MSVEIDPQELGFRRPFTVEVSQVLRIRNTNNHAVAFKVKTTAPKQYCVRPNSGRIEPGNDVEVSVLLQAMRQEPPLDTKCRDKFLVQSVAITADKEFANVAQIWDSVEKSAIQEKKIRVSWLPPSEEGPSQPIATPVRRSVANGFDATPDTAPPAYSSPQEDTSALDDTPAPTQQRDLKPEPETAPSTQLPAALAGAIPAPVAAAAATVKSAAADTYDELKDQLAKAEATIASLKNEVASGLRQRKAAVTSTEGGEEARAGGQLAQAERQGQQQQGGAEGVPVQITALLCLFSFLLAYFFF
ncbi:phosphatidylinositol-binding protein scs2 [Collariella sp. IMI 366227]|nr:phosphatidylinositol-binding protein scs2 [Collariella sp. IMI 366227]